MDKIKDSSRQSKQLEDLTAKMRECKRYVCLNPTPCLRLYADAYLAQIQLSPPIPDSNQRVQIFFF
jgi:hypothetical protein